MLLACGSVASYGENFRRLRGDVSQEEIARRLKLKRQANISAIELGSKVPSARMILRHAAALRHPPSQLMKDVETEYDRIRAGAYDSMRQMSVSGERTISVRPTRSAPNQDGPPLAAPMNDAQHDPVPGAARDTDREDYSDTGRIARAIIKTGRVERPPPAERVVGEYVPAHRPQKSGGRPRVRKHRR